MNQEDLRALAKQLKDFDSEPEIQALYKRGVKYLTDGNENPQMTPLLKTKLQDIIVSVRQKLKDEVAKTGAVSDHTIAELRANDVWIRNIPVRCIVVTTKSISISMALDCY
jgi:hypothetical protein